MAGQALTYCYLGVSFGVHVAIFSHSIEVLPRGILARICAFAFSPLEYGCVILWPNTADHLINTHQSTSSPLTPSKGMTMTQIASHALCPEGGLEVCPTMLHQAVLYESAADKADTTSSRNVPHSYSLNPGRKLHKEPNSRTSLIWTRRLSSACARCFPDSISNHHKFLYQTFR